MVVTLGQQYNSGEKPTVMMYTTYINRHAGTPDKNKIKIFLKHIIIIIINDTLARYLEPVVTECKEHTIHTQTQVVASRKPKEIKRTHEGEANLTT